ncbi:DUF4150 domain-containing protein [Rhizobium sp. P38BS-XIX]|uniref:DUF4150 domain-containing protein n=1 Tax=Rhizobium sp. P38BS-XIX TaxID=2726740 RepID=UPI0014564155|nr:DUF4150 domain-containing protein [Rhizobium sp. P38BS-XIX]NLS00075.1 DUF4150 domain-containing protein [Rhizobium sp. P38BS-XIX]
MVDTIGINGLALCHKNSTGMTRSTLPDICRSPQPPVPYTNIAFARDLAKGTKTVFSHGGVMNGIKGSEFHVSYGDEPGVGRGVKSNTVQAEATWLTWSPNVFMEGQPVTRHTDKMLMNHGNTISAGGFQSRPIRSPENAKETAICEIACWCWVTWRGSSKGQWIDNYVKPWRMRYSTCFKQQVDKQYANTQAGKPGHPGLLSEVGYWDPDNPKNTTENGKPPGKPIGKESPWYSGDWYNIRGSRWLDAVWVDSSGDTTDFWDIKFGDDKENSAAKNDAYRNAAKANGGVYHGEFYVPSWCDGCRDEEDEWQRNSVFNQAADHFRKHGVYPNGVPLPGRMGGPIMPVPVPVPIPVIP